MEGYENDGKCMFDRLGVYSQPPIGQLGSVCSTSNSNVPGAGNVEKNVEKSARDVGP